MERNDNILIISKYRPTFMLISESLSCVDVLVLIPIHELDIASPSGSNVALDYLFFKRYSIR